MNVNNQKYKMFKLMKQGYAEGNKSNVEQCAHCWLQLEEVNPFEYGTLPFEEFFQMKRCYTIYSRHDIDQKINRRRMVEHAMKLCELNPKNPYTFDKKAEEEDLKIEKEKYEKSLIKEEPKQIVEKVVLEEPITVTNALPEEKKNWLNFLFPWKKEGVSNDSKGTN